ncbi:hypothetical protein [Collimonas silvisoli]|uniref:hypothetical protein n=1 Tax=Collimonas silvisoli TaxID=2825884 RepID=UPI001B8CB014|nr:hypothetical protein [Collimonas silvisoli]
MDMQVIANRIQELKNNLSAGQEQLRVLEEKKRDLQATLMRISGAIQVLEELQAEQENAS